MSRSLPGPTDPSTLVRPQTGRGSPTRNPTPSSADQPGPEEECDRLSEQLATLSRRLQVLESDREFLILHVKNLEQAGRHLAHENAQAAARIHQLQQVEQQYQAIVNTRTWRLLRSLTAPVRTVGRTARAARRLYYRARHFVATQR